MKETASNSHFHENWFHYYHALKYLYAIEVCIKKRPQQVLLLNKYWPHYNWNVHQLECSICSFSGLDAETAHHGNREEAARQLCYYRKYREEGHHNVPAETKEVLQNRIDPNYGERERKTVHALLYTPGGE